MLISIDQIVKLNIQKNNTRNGYFESRHLNDIIETRNPEYWSDHAEIKLSFLLLRDKP